MFCETFELRALAMRVASNQLYPITSGNRKDSAQRRASRSANRKPWNYELLCGVGTNHTLPRSARPLQNLRHSAKSQRFSGRNVHPEGLGRGRVLAMLSHHETYAQPPTPSPFCPAKGGREAGVQPNKVAPMPISVTESD